MKLKSGQAPKEMTEKQNWIENKFNFLQMKNRHKGLRKSANNISKASDDMDSMQ